MNQSELEKRQGRAEQGLFIITKTDDGFRISSSLAPAKQSVVSGNPDASNPLQPRTHPLTPGKIGRGDDKVSGVGSIGTEQLKISGLSWQSDC